MKRESVTAEAALERLRAGNQRFVDNDRCLDTYRSHTNLDEHVDGQAPFAIVLGCSDSRVPVEIVFDAGLGDLFVIRVAGNIATPSVIGSIEFAASKFGTRQVVVLGHSECGAVAATIDAASTAGDGLSDNVNAIVSRIEPAVQPLLASVSADRLMAEAVRANVRATVAQLSEGSPTLRDLIQNEGLAIAGAEYSLQTGIVEFFC